MVNYKIIKQQTAQYRLDTFDFQYYQNFNLVELRTGEVSISLTCLLAKREKAHAFVSKISNGILMGDYFMGKVNLVKGINITEEVYETATMHHMIREFSISITFYLNTILRNSKIYV